jgi:hypothetical protein
MKAYRTYCLMLRRSALVLLLVAGAICSAREAAAEKVYVSDLGITSYLHHRLGIHDYMYGPGGVVPRMTGLPAQRRTQRYVTEQGYWRLVTDTPTRPFVERRVVMRPRAERTKSTQRTERFEDFGLAMNLPGKPWTKLDPQEMGSRACLILERSNPTVYISLAADRVDAEADVTNESLLSASQAKMKSFSGGSVESGKKFYANGIEGIAHEATVRDPQGDDTVHY